MAYQALYRAYRPQDFKSVAGQKHIVTTLQNAIKLNKVAHAYLFTGPRGTGKTTMAKIMAKAINCVHGPSIEPCNECAICQGITKGTISDVYEIDAASNNGVEEIRELRDKIKYLPSECKYKVYIIDEVHMLSQGAFNALLKTLEEPPHHAIFILATTEPHKIPATILSRCQRFDFQALSKEDIIDRLKIVIASEKLNVTDEAVDMVSDFCEGGMRDALSLLDQSISFSTDDTVDANDVLAVSGNVSATEILSVLEKAFNGDGASVLSLLSDIISKGKEIPRIINDLIIFLRDVLLTKVGKNNSLKSVYKSREFVNFSTNISNQLVYHWLDILNETLNNIKFTNQKRAYLELGLLKMSDSKLNDYNSLLDRIEKLENKIAFTANVQPQKEVVIEPVEQVTFERDPSKLMSYEELNNIAPESEPQKENLDDSYIQVSDIETVLNNGNKQVRAAITANLIELPSINPNDFVINLMAGAKIGAASDTACVVVLKDISKCNRLMKGSYYDTAIKYLNGKTANINEIYFIPESAWTLILNDFTEQYRAKIANPKLKYVEILVKKHVEEQLEEEIDNSAELASLFNEDIFKIMEE